MLTHFACQLGTQVYIAQLLSLSLPSDGSKSSACASSVPTKCVLVHLSRTKVVLVALSILPTTAHGNSSKSTHAERPASAPHATQHGLLLIWEIANIPCCVGHRRASALRSSSRSLKRRNRHARRFLETQYTRIAHKEQSSRTLHASATRTHVLRQGNTHAHRARKRTAHVLSTQKHAHQKRKRESRRRATDETDSRRLRCSHVPVMHP
eukprot:893109-Pleurochrysis_carterae.AAC.1